MNAKGWQGRIEEVCREAGTYRDFFVPVIETLAGILEMRDKAEAQFIEMGGKPVVEHTNSHGHTNSAKNPAYAILSDCNTQALAYWRDLGLTPAGYKRLNADVVQEEKKSLEALLEKIT